MIFTSDPKPQNKFQKVILYFLILATVALGFLAIYFCPKLNQNSSTKKSITDNLKDNSSIVAPKIRLDFEILEIAKTPQERQIGYMNREVICAKCGMLFVFEENKPLSFWMKNTLVPLKITFIDENGIVINTGIGQPQITSPTVNSNKPAKYVLEVPLNSSIELQPSQILDLEYMTSQSISHTTVK